MLTSFLKHLLDTVQQSIRGIAAPVIRWQGRASIAHVRKELGAAVLTGNRASDQGCTNLMRRPQVGQDCVKRTVILRTPLSTRKAGGLLEGKILALEGP